MWVGLTLRRGPAPALRRGWTVVLTLLTNRSRL
jgi:hypothetical protein